MRLSFVRVCAETGGALQTCSASDESPVRGVRPPRRDPRLRPESTPTGGHVIAAVPSLGRATGVDTGAPEESSALAGLYVRHSERIFAYCLRRLRNREEAEDAVQSTFLQALAALRRGVEPLAEATWLVTIAQNVCHDRWNADRRRRTLELCVDPLELEEPHVPGALDGLGREALARALTHLPETQRRAILLREWQGLSYAEIEADLGMSKAAVETLIFRARRTLADELRHEIETPVTRRIGLRGLDLASILSGLRSLLGGAGVAAKIVAGAAALSVAAGAVGVRELERTQPADPPGRHWGPQQVTRSEQARTPSGAPIAAGGAVPGAPLGGRSVAPERDAPAGPGAVPSPAGEDPTPGSTAPASDAPGAGSGDARTPVQATQQPSASAGAPPDVPGSSIVLPSTGDPVDTATSVVQDPVGAVTSVVDDPVGTVTNTVDDALETVNDAVGGVVEQSPATTSGTSPTVPLEPLEPVVPTALPDASPVVSKLSP